MPPSKPVRLSEYVTAHFFFLHYLAVPEVASPRKGSNAKEVFFSSFVSSIFLLYCYLDQAGSPSTSHPSFPLPSSNYDEYYYCTLPLAGLSMGPEKDATGSFFIPPPSSSSSQGN